MSTTKAMNDRLVGQAERRRARAAAGRSATTIELDVVAEPTLADAICELVAGDPAIRAEVVEESGPGGGHPLVRFAGPAAAIAALIARYEG